jgi:glycosyltransferase involved in cell wall biosynthesis
MLYFTQRDVDPGKKVIPNQARWVKVTPRTAQLPQKRVRNECAAKGIFTPSCWLRRILRPRISVIIPTYQCAQFVLQAVDSVLAQQYPQELVEIIVINDGSTDDTSEALQTYLSRIRYIYQSNRGEGAARNVGVNVAGGDFIAFLDADDFWLPNRLNLMTEALAANTNTLVVTDFVHDIFGKRGDTPIYQQRGLRWLFDLESSEQFKAALDDNFIAWPLVPRDVFRKFGLFDETLHYGTDWDMWLRCLAANYRVVLVPQPCVVYRLFRPGSTTARNDFAKARDRVRVLERHRKYVSKRRWATAVGAMHHLGLRESLAAWAYGKALHHALPLLLNATYMGHVFRGRAIRLSQRSSGE